MIDIDYVSLRRYGLKEDNISTLVFLLENPMDRGAWWATVYGVNLA